MSWSDFRDAGNITGPLANAFSTVDPESFFWWTGALYSSHDIIKNYFAVQMELLYTRGGKTWDLGGDNLPNNVKESHFEITTDYLQLPLLVKFMVPVSSAIIPNIYVGPYISTALRTRSRDMTMLPDSIKNNSAFFSGIDIHGRDLDYAHNVFDVGFCSGIGFQIPFGPGNIDIDGRFNYGTLNVFNFQGGDLTRNYSFMVMLGYSI